MQTIKLRIAEKAQEGDLQRVRLASGKNLSDLGIPHVKDIKFKEYLDTNPVMIYRHNQNSFPIGQIKDMAYDDKSESIMASFMFMDDEPDAELGKIDPAVFRAHHAWDIDYLRGASVGVDFDTELREVSLTPVPHDPTALKLAEAHADLIDSIVSSEELSDGFLEYVDKLRAKNDTKKEQTSGDVKEMDKETSMGDLDASTVTEIVSKQLEAQAKENAASIAIAVAAAMDKRDSDAEKAKAEADAAATAEGDRINKAVADAIAKYKEDNEKEEETTTTVTTPNDEIETGTNPSGKKNEKEEETVETQEELMTRLRGEIEKEHKERTEILGAADGFLPKDYEVEGKSNLEIIKASLGMKDEDEGEEPYLRGRLMATAELRKGKGGAGRKLVTATFGGGNNGEQKNARERLRERRKDRWKNPGPQNNGGNS